MTRKAHLWVLLMWAGLSGLLLFYGYQIYPFPDSDSGAFLPQAVNLARGKGLVNPIFDRAVLTDPAGLGRQYFYPPLFQVAVAALMSEPTARGAFVAVALLNTFALLLSTLLFLRIGAPDEKTNHPHRWILVLLSCLALVGLAGSMNNSTGRPESLGAVLVVAVALVLYPLAPLRPARAVVLGLLLGLTGATHPVGAILLGLLLAGYAFATLSAREACGAIIILLVSSLLVFVGVVLATGTDLELQFRGLAQHARFGILPGSPEASFSSYWLTGVRFPLLGPLMLTAGLAGLHLWQSHRDSLRSPRASAVTAAAATFAAYYFVLRAPPRYYNLAMFAPLAYALILYWLRTQLDRAIPARVLLPAVAVCTIVFLGNASGFARRLLIYPFTHRFGESLENARSKFRQIEDRTSGQLLVTQSLWVLSEDYHRMRLEGVSELPCRYELFLKQQAASGFLRPPALPQHSLVFGVFSNVQPKVLGLRLASTVGGYGFAAYRPTPASASEGNCAPSGGVSR